MLDSDTIKTAFERGEIAECILGDDPEHQVVDRNWGTHEVETVLQRLVFWAKRADRSGEAIQGIEASLGILASRGDMNRMLKVLSAHHRLEPHLRLPLNLEPTVHALTSWVQGDAPLGIDLLMVAENLESVREALEAHHRRSLDELFQRVVFDTPANAHLRQPFMLGLMAADSPILARLAKLNR